jgi:hypothetical protein
MPKKIPVSGGKPRSRSSSREKNGAKHPMTLKPITVAFPERVVKGIPSITNKNYNEQQYYPTANYVRSPGGTMYATYSNEGANTTGLPPYPTFSNSENSENSNLGTPNSAELVAAGAGYAARLPPGVHLTRSRSEGRRRRRPRITRRRRKSSNSESNRSESNRSESNSNSNTRKRRGKSV